MKKVVLGMLLLALAMPAMGAINVTLTQGVGVDANKVSINYACTAGEKVRAWAFDVAVSDKALITSSILREGKTRPQSDDANYYVTPTNAGFNTVGGVVRVWNNPGYGSPAVSADANGCILEMASLYAASDPCVAHRFGPPASGTLMTFRVNSEVNSLVIGCDGAVKVSLAVNAKRGGVVLENGTAATVNMPGQLTMQFTTWPSVWMSPGQWKGDTNASGSVNAMDLLALKNAYNTTAAGSPHGTAKGQYNCACDFNHSGSITAMDLLILKNNYNKTGLPTCPATGCP